VEVQDKVTWMTTWWQEPLPVDVSVEDLASVLTVHHNSYVSEAGAPLNSPPQRPEDHDMYRQIKLAPGKRTAAAQRRAAAVRAGEHVLGNVRRPAL